MSNLGSTQDLGSSNSFSVSNIVNNNATIGGRSSPNNTQSFTAGWKPFPAGGGALLLHLISMIDSASRMELQNHDNFVAISQDQDNSNLIPSLNETLLEIETHRNKIETVLSNNETTVTRHLTALAESIYDVFHFLDKLFEVKFLFFSKGKNKQKLKTLVHNVRLRSNQIMTYVSLELTTTRRNFERIVQLENDDAVCVEAYSHLHGFGTNSKNYVVAYEKFSKLAEGGHPESMYVISDFYKNGIIVKKDKDACRDWLTRAASAGYPKAKCELALEIFTNVREEIL